MSNKKFDAVIVIEGPDGTGKSTLVNAFLATLDGEKAFCFGKNNYPEIVELNFVSVHNPSKDFEAVSSSKILKGYQYIADMTRTYENAKEHLLDECFNILIMDRATISTKVHQEVDHPGPFAMLERIIERSDYVIINTTYNYKSRLAQNFHDISGIPNSTTRRVLCEEIVKRLNARGEPTKIDEYLNLSDAYDRTIGNACNHIQYNDYYLSLLTEIYQDTSINYEKTVAALKAMTAYERKAFMPNVLRKFNLELI